MRNVNREKMRPMACVTSPPFNQCVAFAAHPHVRPRLAHLEPRVFLKRWGGGVALDKILTEVAATYRTQALQLAVIHVHLDVSLHAVSANHPASTGIKNTTRRGC